MKLNSSIPPSPKKFFQCIEDRAWTDAEKELDSIRQNSENTSWSKGYLKALEGLLLTYRNNDDKYIYLPRVLANRSEDSIRDLRNEFLEFASNELHGEYDRGYFKGLGDYLELISTSDPTSTNPPTPVTPAPTMGVTSKNTTKTESKIDTKGETG